VPYAIAWEAKEKPSSRPQEPPPQALTEPDATLSRNPALITQSLRDRGSASEQTTVDSAEQFCSAAAGFVHGVRADAYASDAARIQAVHQNNGQNIPHLRRIEAAIILPPAPKDWVEYPGYIIQRQMNMMAQSPPSYAIPHLFQG
jgi:hypothetical protein